MQKKKKYWVRGVKLPRSSPSLTLSLKSLGSLWVRNVDTLFIWAQLASWGWWTESSTATPSRKPQCTGCALSLVWGKQHPLLRPARQNLITVSGQAWRIIQDFGLKLDSMNNMSTSRWVKSKGGSRRGLIVTNRSEARVKWGLCSVSWTRKDGEPNEANIPEWEPGSPKKAETRSNGKWDKHVYQETHDFYVSLRLFLSLTPTEYVVPRF